MEGREYIQTYIGWREMITYKLAHMQQLEAFPSPGWKEMKTCINAYMHTYMHIHIYIHAYILQAEALRLLAGETRRRRFTHHLRMDKQYVDALEVISYHICMYIHTLDILVT
jgi:hypothetical protein